MKTLPNGNYWENSMDYYNPEEEKKAAKNIIKNNFSWDDPLPPAPDEEIPF